MQGAKFQRSRSGFRQEITLSESNMNVHAVFATAGDFVIRSVGEETILVPVRNSVGNLDAVYTLTPVAARIWQLLDGRSSVAEIAARICDEYDVPGDVALEDVGELLSTLATAQLIQEKAAE
jgi:MinD-like ATPase involved in chromosome partitioning or flagellar assembly